MDKITQDQLTTAFSALSILTRNLVQEELERAQRDTSMEYHRASNGSEEAQKLFLEVTALNFMIRSCKQATEEFDGIVNDQKDHDLSDG